jgi:hypothetical protein
MVQVALHEGIPILEPAVCKAGRSRETAENALTDARIYVKALQKVDRPTNATIAIQQSKPPNRTVYSGLVRVGSPQGVPLFARASGTGFHWPEDIDEAVGAAREKEVQSDG